MEVVILSSVRHAKYTMPVDHENIRYPYNSSLEGSIAYMTPALTSYGLDNIAIATGSLLGYIQNKSFHIPEVSTLSRLTPPTFDEQVP
jgi:hypothetical protein